MIAVPGWLPAGEGSASSLVGPARMAGTGCGFRGPILAGLPPGAVSAFCSVNPCTFGGAPAGSLCSVPAPFLPPTPMHGGAGRVQWGPGDSRAQEGGFTPTPSQGRSEGSASRLSGRRLRW